LESRGQVCKIIVYVDKHNVQVLEDIIGKKPYLRELYGKIGVDIYKMNYIRKEKGETVAQSVYFWVLNPSDVFDFIRSKYEVGASALMMIVDYNSSQSVQMAVKALAEALRSVGSKIPIVVLIKIPDDVYVAVKDKLRHELYQAELDMLLRNGILVGFYLFTERKKKNVKKAIRNLLGILRQRSKIFLSEEQN